MSNKLSIVIMAHPERQEWAKELSQKLNAPIVYDRVNNIWDTCRRAWLSQVSVGAEYTLVLQDDSIVCENFRERAEAVLDSQDADFITSFFAGYLCATKIKRALVRKEPYFLSGMIFNEVALCMRTEHIEEMVAYCDARETKTDQEITKWARLKRLRIYYPVPSLVDHRDGESIYRRVYQKPAWSRPRVAFKYVDRKD